MSKGNKPSGADAETFSPWSASISEVTSVERLGPLGQPLVRWDGTPSFDYESRQRYLVSIHESGHAVFLLYYGRPLGQAGVWLNENGGECEGGWMPESAENVPSQLAGFLAESEWRTPGSQLAATDLESARHAMHLFIDTENGPRSDAAKVMRLAEKQQSSDPDGLMTSWIVEARNVLRERTVWNSVVAVANSLYVSGSLNDLEVMSAVDSALHGESLIVGSVIEGALAAGMRACRFRSTYRNRRPAVHSVEITTTIPLPEFR